MANKFDIWVILGFKDKATKDMKKAEKGFKDTAKTIAKIGVAAAAAAVALKKIYDAGKQGAAIAQTTESFNRLGVSIESMRAASLNTIDDMTLMSSTLTLTAGASEALQAQLLDSAPQLLNIAKAANKLNPTLGDTATMYESIATGIKRSSPLILDNLGIVVKVSEANQNYADAMGKAVTELTAEEKQMALLNETMRAGNRLIEQVGGNVESMTDSYAQLETHVKNVTDAMKAQLAEGIGPMVESLADAVIITPKLTDLFDEQVVALAAAEFAATGNREALDALEATMERADRRLTKSAGKHRENTDAINAEIDALERMRGISSVSGLISHIGDTAGKAAEEIEILTVSAEDNAAAFEWMIQATLDAQEAASQLHFDRVAEEAALAAIAWNDAAAALSEMSMASFVATQMDLLTQAFENGKISAQELEEAQRALLIETGLLTESEIFAQEQMEGLRASFERGAINAETLATRLRGIKSGLDNIPNFKKIVIEIEERRTISTRHAQEGFDEQIGGTNNAGGFNGIVSQPTLMRVGEDGPEKVNISPITNNFGGLTINTRGASQGFAQEWMQLQALNQ